MKCTAPAAVGKANENYADIRVSCIFDVAGVGNSGAVRTFVVHQIECADDQRKTTQRK